MAILKQGTVFTAGSTGATLQSGFGTALINGVRVNLSDIHFPSVDTIAMLTGAQAEHTLANTGITLTYTDVQLGNTSIFERGVMPGQQGFAQLNFGDTRLFVFQETSTFNIDGLTGTIDIDAGAGTEDVTSGLRFPSGTTVEVLGSSIAFIEDGGGSTTLTVHTEGALSLSADAVAMSGHGLSSIRGSSVSLSNLHYPFSIGENDSIELLPNSLLITE